MLYSGNLMRATNDSHLGQVDQNLTTTLTSVSHGQCFHGLTLHLPGPLGPLQQWLLCALEAESGKTHSLLLILNRKFFWWNTQIRFIPLMDLHFPRDRIYEWCFAFKTIFIIPSHSPGFSNTLTIILCPQCICLNFKLVCMPFFTKLHSIPILLIHLSLSL